jgi:hypothetical protein
VRPHVPANNRSFVTSTTTRPGRGRVFLECADAFAIKVEQVFETEAVAERTAALDRSRLQSRADESASAKIVSWLQF